MDDNAASESLLTACCREWILHWIVETRLTRVVHYTR